MLDLGLDSRLQQYELRPKDRNKAASILLAPARVLGCKAEEALEYNNSVNPKHHKE